MLYSAEQTQDFSQHQFAFLEVEEKGHLLRLMLNRPEKKNALTPTLVRELAFALSYAHHQPHIWAVVLGARGDTFCSGADLKAFMGKEPDSGSTIPAEPQEIVLGDLFRQVHRPVVVQVQGDVYAGGFLLLCGATQVVAADSAHFGLPEVKRGIWPMQVMASLLQVMPARKALDFCMRARKVDAAEALELGLVTQVVTGAELDAAVQALVEELFTYSPTAIRMGLQAYDEMQAKAPHEVHGFLKQMLARNLNTADAREGMMAFLQKRKPEWKGN